MKHVLYIVLLLLSTAINGQVGQEFWFVAPDIWEGHGDSPIILRVTTFDEAAVVTVSLPADNGRVLEQRTVPANSQVGIELLKEDVENYPANQINNKGLLIESTRDITAYYDISAVSNPDKFVLKEENALGLEFFIPSQNIYGNDPQFGGNANEKADIVATEDNTKVTIVPAIDITGHAAGIPFEITLNKGQTYCIECRDISPSAALAGTHIVADKFIAVTISDDSLIEDVDSYPSDLIGDQLIASNVIGTEYIAMNTSKAATSYKNQNSVQKVFVLAIEDNTLVFLNNTSKTVKALNKGEIAEFDISDHSAYIFATKNVYAYQLTGLVNTNTTSANELSSAILPSYSCNGSQKVSFTRVFDRDFWVNLIIKRKHVKNFTMRDSYGNDINIGRYFSSWQTVPGQDTGQEAWVSCAVNMNDITTGLPYTIENSTGLFHLCILDETDSKDEFGGTSFGYFSSYNSFWTMGPNQTCLGEDISLKAKDGMLNYQWFSTETGNQVLSTNSELIISESGIYWVEAEVQFGGCKVTDSLDINFMFPEVELGNDTTVCQGESLTFSVSDAYSSYLWNTGDAVHEINVIIDGTTDTQFDVTVTDEMGCTNSDTVNVYVAEVPDIVLNSNDVCEGSSVFNTTNFERYEWRFNGVLLNDDKTQNWIIPTVSGTYSITGWTDEGCAVTDDIQIVVHPLPMFTLSNQMACNGVPMVINGPSGFDTYNWSNGSTASSITLDVDTDYWLEVTDANGCTAREYSNLRYHEAVPIDLGPDRDECVGVTLSIRNSSDFSNFSWTFNAASNPSSTIILTPNPDYEYEIVNSDISNSGVYTVSAIDINGCEVQDDVTITFHDANPPSLRITENLCDGEVVNIIATEGYDSYKWYLNNIYDPTLDNLSQINNITTSGLYRVEASSAACIKTNEIDVVQHGLPTIDLPDVFSICDGVAKELTVNMYSSSSGASLDYLYWNNNSNERFSNWQTSSLLISAAGSYSVTAVDEFGCKASDAVSVTSVVSPVLDLGLPQNICDYENIRLTNPIVGVQSYSWYKNSYNGELLMVNNAPLDVLSSGTYVLKVIDLNGCELSDEVAVNVNASPIIDLGDDRIECDETNVEIVAQDKFAQYRWNDDPLENTNKLTVTTTGDYKLEVWNAEGCVAEDIVNITVVESPNVTLQDALVCAGDEVLLSGPSGDYTYLWSTGATSQVLSAVDGKYKLTVTSLNGCSASAEASVRWRPVPDVDLGPDMIICPADEWVLDAGNGFQSYQWHNGSNSPSIIANLLDTVNTVVVSDEFGCYGFDSQTVKYKVAPDIELISDTSICNSDTIMIHVDPSFLIYEWNTGDNLSSIEVSEEGQYSLRVFDGCVWANDTMQLVVNPTPVIAMLDTSIYAQVIVIPDGGFAPYRYAINDEDFQSNNVFGDLSNGEHLFEVQDVNGCSAMESIILNNIFDIKIPPILTPNGDGYNDVWEIKGLDKVPNSVIRIFDRYGKLLVEYLASDPPWDGKYLGKAVASDAYWYVIELVPIGKTLKGHLTIKR